MKRHIFLFPLAITLAAASAHCRANDDSQQNMRENPNIDTVGATVVRIPGYVKLDKNHIAFNGSDPLAFSVLDSMARERVVSVVFIGDSHLQADMGSSVTRRRMADRYGHAGRGLTVPFRLAGTNEPVDYKISLTCPVTEARLLKKPWPVEMGFTGIAVAPHHEQFSATITAREPFDSVEVFFTGEWLAAGDSLGLRADKSPMRLSVGQADSTHTFAIACAPNTSIHGFNLVKTAEKGVVTHVIGNNGATYATYNQLHGFSSDVALLSPDLIILSLGTNEAFSKISESEMYADIDAMVSSLRSANPSARILLTTPSECQKKTTVRRRKRRRTTVHQVNAKVARMADVIRRYAADNSLPVYDFYEVAGGPGSSSLWLKDTLLNKDRIHLTRKGYTLQGTLFTNALEEAIAKDKR